MTRLPGDRALNHGGVGWVEPAAGGAGLGAPRSRPPAYRSLADVARDWPPSSREYKSAAYFFANGAASVRILGSRLDLIEIEAWFPT